MSNPTLTTRDSPSTTSQVPTCTTAVPDDRGHVPIDACNSNYSYDPSLAANVAFAVLFGLSLIAHFTQAVAWKKRFCWVLIMGAIWEFTGFTFRSLGSENQQNIPYAIAGELFFLLAPLWINAFAYMTVARIIYYAVSDQAAWGIKATWLTRIFVWVDVICFLIQATGGTLMSDTEGAKDAPILQTGKYVYMAGCGAQLASILIFFAMIFRVYRKICTSPRREANIKRAKILTLLMFAVLVLVVMRIIFRLVEFGPGAGSDNPILAHEAYALGLDAFPMSLACILLNVVHPGWVLRGPDGEFPKVSRAEKKRLKQDKKRAKEAKKQLKKDAKNNSNGSFAKIEDNSPKDLVTGPRYDSMEMAQGQFPRYGDDGRPSPYGHTGRDVV